MVEEDEVTQVPVELTSEDSKPPVSRTSRLVYKREFLLSLKSHGSCKQPPPGLDPAIIKAIAEPGIPIPHAGARGRKEHEGEVGAQGWDATSRSPQEVPEWRKETWRGGSPAGGQGQPPLLGPHRRRPDEESNDGVVAPGRPSGNWENVSKENHDRFGDRPGPNHHGPPGQHVPHHGHLGHGRWDHKPPGDRDRDRGFRGYRNTEDDEGDKSRHKPSTRRLAPNATPGIGQVSLRPGWSNSDHADASKDKEQEKDKTSTVTSTASSSPPTGDNPSERYVAPVRAGRPGSTYQPPRNKEDGIPDNETFSERGSTDKDRLEQERRRREEFETMRVRHRQAAMEQKQKEKEGSAKKKHDLEGLWDPENFFDDNPLASSATPPNPTLSPELKPKTATPVPGSTPPRPNVPPGFSKPSTPIAAPLGSPALSVKNGESVVPFPPGFGLPKPAANEKVPPGNDEPAVPDKKEATRDDMSLKENVEPEKNKLIKEAMDEPAETTSSKFARWFSSQEDGKGGMVPLQNPAISTDATTETTPTGPSLQQVLQAGCRGEKGFPAPDSPSQRAPSLDSPAQVPPMPKGPSLEDIELAMSGNQSKAKDRPASTVASPSSATDFLLSFSAGKQPLAGKGEEGRLTWATSVQVPKAAAPKFMTLEDIEQAILAEAGTPSKGNGNVGVLKEKLGPLGAPWPNGVNGKVEALPFNSASKHLLSLLKGSPAGNTTTPNDQAIPDSPGNNILSSLLPGKRTDHWQVMDAQVAPPVNHGTHNVQSLSAWLPSKAQPNPVMLPSTKNAALGRPSPSPVGPIGPASRVQKSSSPFEAKGNNQGIPLSDLPWLGPLMGLQPSQLQPNSVAGKEAGSAQEEASVFRGFQPRGVEKVAGTAASTAIQRNVNMGKAETDLDLIPTTVPGSVQKEESGSRNGEGESGIKGNIVSGGKATEAGSGSRDGGQAKAVSLSNEKRELQSQSTESVAGSSVNGAAEGAVKSLSRTGSGSIGKGTLIKAVGSQSSVGSGRKNVGNGRETKLADAFVEGGEAHEDRVVESSKDSEAAKDGTDEKGGKKEDGGTDLSKLVAAAGVKGADSVLSSEGNGGTNMMEVVGGKDGEEVKEIKSGEDLAPFGFPGPSLGWTPFGGPGSEGNTEQLLDLLIGRKAGPNGNLPNSAGQSKVVNSMQQEKADRADHSFYPPNFPANLGPSNPQAGPQQYQQQQHPFSEHLPAPGQYHTQESPLDLQHRHAHMHEQAGVAYAYPPAARGAARYQQAGGEIPLHPTLQAHLAVAPGRYQAVRAQPGHNQLYVGAPTPIQMVPAGMQHRGAASYYPAAPGYGQFGTDGRERASPQHMQYGGHYASNVAHAGQQGAYNGLPGGAHAHLPYAFAHNQVANGNRVGIPIQAAGTRQAGKPNEVDPGQGLDRWFGPNAAFGREMPMLGKGPQQAVGLEELEQQLRLR